MPSLVHCVGSQSEQLPAHIARSYSYCADIWACLATPLSLAAFFRLRATLPIGRR